MSRIEPQNKTVAVSIVTWNNRKEVGDCLRPLQNLPANWEIWIADNDSQDETVELIRREFPRVNIIANRENLGFAAAHNQIIGRTETDYVLILNPDTIGDADALQNALAEIENRPPVAVLGVKLLNDDGSLQQTCFPFPTVYKNAIESLGLYRFFPKAWRRDNLFNDFFDHDAPKKVDWLMGAFWFARREILNATDGLPEDYFMFGEDIDFCYKVRQAGGEVFFCPAISVVHKRNQSAGQMPSDWRVERATLSKYGFCYKNFGALKTKIIQLTDYVGKTLGIWYLTLRKPASPQIAEWRQSRKFVRQAIFLPPEKLWERLRKR